MTTINISLPDKLKNFADQQINGGYYASFSDLVRTALRQLLFPGQNFKEKVVFDKNRIAAFCREAGIKSLKLFGSLARGEAKPESDVDLLVEFETKKVPGLLGLLEMERRLSHQFGRPVELVTKLNKYVKPYVRKDLIPLYEKR
jgi:predicted nucleotidyltransferase